MKLIAANKTSGQPDSSVAFTGYYGMQNFGDDLFALLCSWGAKNYWQQSHVTLISPPIKGVEARFAVPHWYNRNTYGSLNVLGKMSRLAFGVREMIKNDTIIFGGGSLFANTETGMMKLHRQISRYGNLQLGAVGISIGPFDSTESASKMRGLLSELSYISVRDKASYALAHELNLPSEVVMAGDLAGLMLQVVPQRVAVPASTPNIGVALCDYRPRYDDDCSQKNIEALIIGVINVAKRHAAKVSVFSLNNHQIHGDDALALKLSTRLSTEKIPHSVYRNSDCGAIEIWDRITNCSAFVSVRMHGAVAAYLSGVPFALFEYHTKCTDFLDDIGHDQGLRLGSSNVTADGTVKIVEKLLQGPTSPVISPKEYSRQSMQNFSAAPWAHGATQSLAII